MRVVIYTNGTRGDVQPFVALGVGLRQAGHEVRICTFKIFRELVLSWGLEFAPLGDADPKVWSQQEGTRTYVETGRGVVRMLLKSIRDAWYMMGHFLSDSWEAGQDADAIIGSLFAVSAYHVAEKRQVPFVGGFLLPYGRTHIFPNTMLMPSGRSLGGPLNWFTHVLAEQLVWQPFHGLINRWRREALELPPIPFAGAYAKMRRQQIPHFYGLSPALLPKPADWPDWWHITGTWLLKRPAEWQAPPELADFLSAGPPPVYIGFGSLHGHSSEAWTRIVLEALARTGQRGILEAGWGALSTVNLPDGVFAIDESVPHAWLFPQVAAVISSAGGTTASGLRAGVPSITVPQAFDQPFWARRVAEIGVGPAPIPRSKLSADRLAKAIQVAVNDQEMQDRAAILGKKIQAEDGVTRAVELFRHYCQRADWAWRS